MSCRTRSERDPARARGPARALVHPLRLLVLAMLLGAPGLAGAQVGGYGYLVVTPDLRLCPALELRQCGFELPLHVCLHHAREVVDQARWRLAMLLSGCGW